MNTSKDPVEHVLCFFTKSMYNNGDPVQMASEPRRRGRQPTSAVQGSTMLDDVEEGY